MEKSIALVVLLYHCINCSELMLHDFQVWFQCIDPQQMKMNTINMNIYIYLNLTMLLELIIEMTSNYKKITLGVEVRMREEHDEQIYGSRIF